MKIQNIPYTHGYMNLAFPAFVMLTSSEINLFFVRKKQACTVQNDRER